MRALCIHFLVGTSINFKKKFVEILFWKYKNIFLNYNHLNYWQKFNKFKCFQSFKCTPCHLAYFGEREKKFKTFQKRLSAFLGCWARCSVSSSDDNGSFAFPVKENVAIIFNSQAWLLSPANFKRVLVD